MQNQIVLGALHMEAGQSVDFYRSWGVFHVLPSIGRFYSIPHKGTKWNKYFQTLDILYIDRRFVAEAIQLIQAAKENNIKIWLDLDDDLFNISPFHDAVHALSSPKVQQSIKQAIELSDIITVTTPILKDLYQPLNENIEVIPNAWNDFIHPKMKIPMQATRKKPRVAWRGSNSHRRDIFDVHKVVNAYMDRFAWTFYGMLPECLDVAAMNVPFSELYTYFAVFAKNQTDYLFCPLEDTRFNQSRSNIAWIEAAVLAGAPCIAPINMPEFNVPGVIQYKGNKGLEQVFKGVADNRFDRVGLVMDAQEYIRENLALSKVNELRTAVVERLMQIEPVTT